MIPILYEKDETAFASNGLGRLRDCISCVVSEERNGIYECDFEYPIDGANADLIQVGRIIGVTHDETGDIQPFDIVSYSRPIEGVVTYHCTHISYRQSYITVTGSNINSLSDAFTLFASGVPSNPFSYQSDKSSSGFLACADGTPRSVREMLGGIEGSILDAYGGEYEWNKWQVILHSARGQLRDFSIRYGVNMVDYTDETDIEGSYSSCVPYWTDGENKVIGSRQDSGSQTITNRGECVPLDVSDKFESQPTKAQVESAGLSYMSSNNTFRPSQTIHVEFVRLQDMGEALGYQNLLQCSLCDIITVYFPDYNSSGQYKIVRTEWDVLQGKYQSMELGDLAVSLAEALGISNTLERSGSGGGGGGAVDASDVSVTTGGSTSDAQTLFNTLFTNFQSRCDMSSHTIAVGSINGNTTKADQTNTFSKSGYFPLAIAGWNINNGVLNPTQVDLSTRSNGSVTVRWSVRNLSSSSVSSANLYVRILWIKTTY